MTFNFIEQYIQYNRGNECPRNYHIWSCLVVLAAAAHKQVWVNQGYFTTYCNLYVGLIGDMGSRKSTGKDIAYDLFITTFPDYPILASVQSREDIIKYMNSDACLFSYKDASGSIIEVRPIAGFINELKNFLSVDPGKMIEFLTDIYSSKHFKSSTIKRGLEDLKNPCINLLACETPEWIIDKLKGKIISGGWARRIIYVYETSRAEPIAFPQKPMNSGEMWQSLMEHLKKVHATVGEFVWDPDAREWYKEWYDRTRKTVHEDKLMAGYYESKHDQLLKVAMLLALAAEDIKLVITKANLEVGVSMLDSLEENMPKLFSAAGRNELAIPMANAIELLEKSPDQMLPEKVFNRMIGKDLSPIEIEQVKRFLKDTDQLFVKNVDFVSIEKKKVSKLMVMTKERYDKLTKKGV